jgi:hypothetical protein
MGAGCNSTARWRRADVQTLDIGTGGEQIDVQAQDIGTGSEQIDVPCDRNGWPPIILSRPRVDRMAGWQPMEPKTSEGWLSTAAA